MRKLAPEHMRTLMIFERCRCDAYKQLITRYATDVPGGLENLGDYLKAARRLYLGLMENGRVDNRQVNAMDQAFSKILSLLLASELNPNALEQLMIARINADQERAVRDALLEDYPWGWHNL